MKIVPVPNSYRRGYPSMNYAPLPMSESRHGNYRMDDNQSEAIDQHLKSKLVDNVLLNQLLAKYIGQNGSEVDVDSLSRLLDGSGSLLLTPLRIDPSFPLATMLDNLVNQYQVIDDSRARTLDNYGAKKLHVNTFMNVVSVPSPCFFVFKCCWMISDAEFVPRSASSRHWISS